MDTETPDVELETKSILVVPFLEFKMDEQAGTFEGYGSTYGNVDYGGDVCEKGCFDRTLSEHKAKDTMPGLYYGHSPHDPVGDWLEIGSNAKGLPAKGVLWIGKGIPRAEQEYMRLKSKGPKGLSIGYRTKKYLIDNEKKVRRLQDVDLVEISLVPFGMNPKAAITGVKSRLLVDGQPISKRQAEHILREVGGFSQAEAKARIAKAWAGLMEDDAAARDATDAKANQELAEIIARNIALTR